MVVPYDPSWPQKFAQEAVDLQTALTGAAISFHHIGSTAVPGLWAKPIIDMMGIVRTFQQFDQYRDRWIEQGYEALGAFGIEGRRYFRKFDRSGRRLFHIHVFEEGSPHIERHIAFRDYLIAHPRAAESYSRLKQVLASTPGTSWDSYLDGKETLVKELESAALRWHKTRAIQEP